MERMKTRGGVELEALRKEPYDWHDRLADLAEAVLVWLLVAVFAAVLAACAADFVRAVKETIGGDDARECLERNIRSGVYGDETCGFGDFTLGARLNAYAGGGGDPGHAARP